MIVITDQADLVRVTHPGIKKLIAIRLEQLGDLAAGTSPTFIIVESGDSASTVQQSAGFPMLTSLFDDLPFDHPDFYPCHELLEEHHHEQCRFYEMVFIGNDDGAATAIFVPDETGIDTDMLALCRSWATPAAVSMP